MAYNFDDSDFEELQEQVENLELELENSRDSCDELQEHSDELAFENAQLENEIRNLEKELEDRTDYWERSEQLKEFESKLREVRIFLDKESVEEYGYINQAFKALADSIVDLFKEYEISL